MIDLKKVYKGFRNSNIREIIYGLRQPKDTEEYKWAKKEFKVKRISWGSAVISPILALAIIGSCAINKTYDSPNVTARMIEPTPMTEQLDPIEPLELSKVPEFNHLENIVEFNNPSIEKPSIIEEPSFNYDNSPEMISDVSPIKSPIIFKGVYQSRGSNARKVALTNYGAPKGSETAVINALRWLKVNQLDDGSWSQTSKPASRGEVKPAMTGLALLVYLAHGETPGSSEFGYTVEKAIKWLVDNQEISGKFNGRDGHDYSLPIATYALSEAFTMTKIPMVKEAAQKAVKIIIDGQNKNGAFDYNCKPGGTQRNDLSYGGWCVQALKAAKIAHLDVDGLDEAFKKAIHGTKVNFKGDYNMGGFGYSSPAQHPLTGVGALSLQLLGASDHEESIGAMKYITNVQPKEWGSVTWRDLYHWYYDIQAAFHEGGNTWEKWNNEFATLVANNQTVLKGNYEDNKDIGYWSTTGNSKGLVYNTVTATLMLEVYYRYLPTFQNIQMIENVAPEDPGDIPIEIF